MGVTIAWEAILFWIALSSAVSQAATAPSTCSAPMASLRCTPSTQRTRLPPMCASPEGREKKKSRKVTNLDVIQALALSEGESSGDLYRLYSSIVFLKVFLKLFIQETV